MAIKPLDKVLQNMTNHRLYPLFIEQFDKAREENISLMFLADIYKKLAFDFFVIGYNLDNQNKENE